MSPYEGEPLPTARSSQKIKCRLHNPTDSQEGRDLKVFKEEVAVMDLMNSGFTKTFAENRHKASTKNDYKSSVRKTKASNGGQRKGLAEVPG